MDIPFAHQMDCLQLPALKGDQVTGGGLERKHPLTPSQGIFVSFTPRLFGTTLLFIRQPTGASPSRLGSSLYTQKR